MAITNPNEKQYFDDFEKMILESDDHYFTQPEMLNLYRTALNYCAAKVNQGELEYSRRALKFYRKGVENGALIENGIISRYTFGNAVGFAIKIGEFDWAEQFVERFQHFLDEKERNSIINFNLSRLYFDKGDYNKAQRLLTQFEYDDMILNIIAKTMLLKIYYERSDLDAFESLIESLRIYLQRKEALNPARKAAYKNLVSLMKKLLNLNIYSKVQKDKFRELVLKTNPLTEREWFLKQLDAK
jgi:tetratricopeptide (TPR) repeat protein